MNDGLLTILILGAELGAVILLIFVIFIIIRFKRRNADKTYVRDFIREYNESKHTHNTDIKNRLEVGCHIVGEDAKQAMNMVTTSEKKLFKRVLNLYLGNERDCLSDIQKDVAVLSDNWLSVVQEGATNAMTAVCNNVDTMALEGKISELEEKNHEMSSKLDEAMKTMEEIIIEYARLYADKDEKDEKMEKLSGKYDELKGTHDTD